MSAGCDAGAPETFGDGRPPALTIAAVFTVLVAGFGVLSAAAYGVLAVQRLMGMGSRPARLGLYDLVYVIDNAVAGALFSLLLAAALGWLGRRRWSWRLGVYACVLLPVFMAASCAAESFMEGYDFWTACGLRTLADWWRIGRPFPPRGLVDTAAFMEPILILTTFFYPLTVLVFMLMPATRRSFTEPGKNKKNRHN